jgi:DhnA family fructose-bisphosphate aldolase class Ia
LSSLILAADHRARGVITIEHYASYLGAVQAALGACDGVLATAKPLADLHIRPGQKTYLSNNRSGLSGSVFELDDRLVASVARAAADGWTGIKHMTRIDLSSEWTSPALELLGRVLEDCVRHGLEALIEPVAWKDGGMDRRVEQVVLGAVIAHDMGAPLIKVAVPAADPGVERIRAVNRVVESVGVPVLFLGGPRRTDRSEVLDEVRDVMAGGADGLAIGRAVYEDPDPAGMAAAVAEIIHA